MMDRREFIKNLGLTGTGTVLAGSPWLSHVCYMDSGVCSGYLFI